MFLMWRFPEVTAAQPTFDDSKGVDSRGRAMSALAAATGAKNPCSPRARLGSATLWSVARSQPKGLQTTHSTLRPVFILRSQDSFTLWKDADPDIPIHMAAKAEYARLQ